MMICVTGLEQYLSRETMHALGAGINESIDDEVFIKHDRFCIQNYEFCITNDGFLYFK